MDNQKKGVAMEYAGNIPRIIAIARGKLLEKLLALAGQYNITIYKDPDLAEVLSVLPIGSEIPEEMFTAVSEVLAFCYKVNANFRGKIKNSVFHNE